MTTIAHAVNDTPFDVLTLATVNTGTAYTVTNRGQSTVFWADTPTAPEIDTKASHPILPGDTWTVRPTGPQWVWCAGGTSTIAISEAA